MALFGSSYLFGRAADQWGRKPVLVAGLLLSSLTFALQVLASDVTTLVLVRFTAGFTAGVFPAALAAYVYESRGRIGRFASWGSLGWGVGNVAAGLLAVHARIFTFASACFVLAFAVALTLPESGTRTRVPFFPREILRRTGDVYATFFVRHAMANAIWIVFPLFMIDELGATPGQIGLIYAVNMTSQFAVMPLLDRYDPRRLFELGTVLSAVTFAAFTLATSPYHLVPAEVLLGVSWSMTYVGALRYAVERNAERGTAAGLLNSSSSLALTVGPLLGGVLYGWVGFRPAMWIAAAFTMLSAVSFVGVTRALKLPRARRAEPPAPLETIAGPGAGLPAAAPLGPSDTTPRP